MINLSRRMRIKSTARIILTVLLTVLVIIPQTGCGNKEPVSKSDFCLDTACKITIYDMSKSEAEEILNKTYEEIRRYENLLSKTIKDSDIYNINNAGGKSVKISEETAEVINLGIKIGDISKGAFDITIGGVTDLWDFKSENPEVPEADRITEALGSVDYTKVNVKGTDVIMGEPDAQMDLGGIAKGYIADRVGEFLEEQGVTKAIIDLGGNISTIGEKEQDTPWTIGIERPYSDRTEIIAAIKVSDATVVTSGIYERQFVEDGVRYHHVLDPETGYPSKSDLEAVTIVAAKGNSAFCDGLSTTCLLLGKEKALELVKELQQEYPDMQLQAALIDKDDKMVQTDGMNLEPIEE